MTILVAVRKEGKVALASDSAVYLADAMYRERDIDSGKIMPCVRGGHLGITGGSLFMELWRDFETTQDRRELADLSSPALARYSLRRFRRFCVEGDERIGELDPEDWPTFLAVHPRAGCIMRLTWDGGVDRLRRYMTVGARRPAFIADGVVETWYDRDRSAGWIAEEAVRVACRVAWDIVSVGDTIPLVEITEEAQP